jgi:hypothetical protein
MWCTHERQALNIYLANRPRQPTPLQMPHSCPTPLPPMHATDWQGTACLVGSGHVGAQLSLTSAHQASPEPVLCSRPGTLGQVQPPPGTPLNVKAAFPSIQGIKQYGKQDTPFMVYTYFWCGGGEPHSHWHCRYRDLVSQHDGHEHFYNAYGGALQKVCSRAKTVLNVVYNRARRDNVSFVAFDQYYTSSVLKGKCDQHTYNTLCQYAGLLDTQWARETPKAWAVWFGAVCARDGITPSPADK